MYVDASSSCNELAFQLGSSTIDASTVSRGWSIKVSPRFMSLCLLEQNSPSFVIYRQKLLSYHWETQISLDARYFLFLRTIFTHCWPMAWKLLKSPQIIFLSMSKVEVEIKHGMMFRFWFLELTHLGFAKMGKSREKITFQIEKIRS